MADEKKQGLEETQETVKDETAKKDEIDIETIRAENERLKKESELKANEIKTRDRKLTELQKEVNSTKTLEEQKALEAEERRKAGIARYGKLAVKSVGLADDFAELITGNDEEEIDLKIETFQKIKSSIEEPHIKQIKTLEATIKAQEEEIKILKASGAVPKKGDGTDGKVISRADFNVMSDVNKSTFMKSGGTIED
jgi:hypothetical protein